jgi:predicted nucleic acid-binding protein
VIVLDTNVVSELIRPRPDARVLAWVDGQQARSLTITAVTAAELRYGVARMSKGRRRTNLEADIDALITRDFADRVLPFGVDASGAFGAIVVNREAIGQPITTADAQLAAICRTTGATLATRNIADFIDTGVELVNPWET